MCRDRWHADYRAARSVRRFENALLRGAFSSLGEAAPLDAYCATMNQRDPLKFNRTNGRYGLEGRTKRHINGPLRRLPA